MSWSGDVHPCFHDRLRLNATLASITLMQGEDTAIHSHRNILEDTDVTPSIVSEPLTLLGVVSQDMKALCDGSLLANVCVSREVSVTAKLKL
jgi:hypothetical protein